MFLGLWPGRGWVVGPALERALGEGAFLVILTVVVGHVLVVAVVLAVVLALGAGARAGPPFPCHGAHHYHYQSRGDEETHEQATQQPLASYLEPHDSHSHSHSSSS